MNNIIIIQGHAIVTVGSNKTHVVGIHQHEANENLNPGFFFLRYSMINDSSLTTIGQNSWSISF